MLSQIRAAISANGGAPSSFRLVAVWRELVTAYGGTPTQWSVIGLMREAIEAVGGTPTQWTEKGLLRELLASLGETVTSHNLRTLYGQLAAAVYYTPASLFASSEQGAFYDPSDLASMWQDSAGTTPAANDQPIGKLDDKSGNGNHIIQATAGQRPTKRFVGGKHYVAFDNTLAQWLGANLANMRIVGDLTIVAAIEQAGASTIGAIAVCQTASGAVTPYEFRYNGTTTLLMRHAAAASFEDTTLTVPTTAIVASVRRDVGDTIEMSVNGTRASSAKPIVPTADASSQFRVGGRVVDSVCDLTGRLYGLVVIGRRLSDTELADLEAYMAAKAGIAL